MLNTQIHHAEIKGDRVVLQIATGSETSYITAEHVIVATGFKVDLRRHAFLSLFAVKEPGVFGVMAPAKGA